MKIANVNLKKQNVGSVVIQRDGNPVVIVVCPLPNNFSSRMKSHGLGIYPEPPMKPKRDGKKFVTDKTTGQPVLEADVDDPAYVAEHAAVSRRIGAVMFREILRLDPNVSWDDPEPAADASNQQWQDFADAIAVAIDNSGLTNSEIAAIKEESFRVARPIDVVQGAEDFLPKA